MLNIEEELFNFLDEFDLKIPRSLEIFSKGEQITNELLKEFILSYLISEELVQAAKCFQFEAQFKGFELVEGECKETIKDFITKYLVAADMGLTLAEFVPGLKFVPTKSNLLEEIRVEDPLRALQEFEKRFGKDCFNFEGGCTLQFRLEMLGVLRAIDSTADQETKLELIRRHLQKWTNDENWKRINIEDKEESMRCYYLTDYLLRAKTLADDIQKSFPWTKVGTIEP